MMTHNGRVHDKGCYQLASGSFFEILSGLWCSLASFTSPRQGSHNWRYIIKVPLHYFLDLVEELECEDEKIVFIHNCQDKCVIRQYVGTSGSFEYGC